MASSHYFASSSALKSYYVRLVNTTAATISFSSSQVVLGLSDSHGIIPQDILQILDIRTIASLINCDHDDLLQ